MTLRQLYRTMSAADLRTLRAAFRLDARADWASEKTRRFCARRIRAIGDVLKEKRR